MAARRKEEILLKNGALNQGHAVEVDRECLVVNDYFEAAASTLGNGAGNFPAKTFIEGPSPSGI